MTKSKQIPEASSGMTERRQIPEASSGMTKIKQIPEASLGMTEVEKDSHDCVAEMIENLPFYHYIDYKLLLNL